MGNQTDPNTPDQDQDQDQDTNQPEDKTTPPSPNAEAARYRRRLREAEAERDELAAKVSEFETAERDAELSHVRAEHATRVGMPALAEHLAGDDEEQITADADRARTIITTALAEHYHPDTGIIAQAGDLLAEHGVTADSQGFTLEGAAHLLSRLPEILADDNPGRELAEILKHAQPARSGPFVALPPHGTRRQVAGGDAAPGMSVGEAMRGML